MEHPVSRRIGYRRINTLCRPALPQLESVSIDAVFTDVIRRKKQLHLQFHAMLQHIRPGDTLVVQSIDRLGRDPQEFLKTVRALTQNGVCIECVSEGIVFPAGESSMMRNWILLIMTAFHHAAQSWSSELRSEARRQQSVK